MARLIRTKCVAYAGLERLPVHVGVAVGVTVAVGGDGRVGVVSVVGIVSIMVGIGNIARLVVGWHVSLSITLTHCVPERSLVGCCCFALHGGNTRMTNESDLKR
jgi:hypothetical protein